MVGDRDLQLLKEPNSQRAAGDLVDRIWSTGQAAGFPNSSTPAPPSP
jgi:hypothetical protein